MMDFVGGHMSVQSADVAQLELHLQAALRPVAPRMDFVKDLQQRLLEEAQRQKPPVKVNKEAWYQSILALAGVLSGTVLLVLGVRAIATLVGSKRAINRIKEVLPLKQTTHLRPVL